MRRFFRHEARPDGWIKSFCAALYLVIVALAPASAEDGLQDLPWLAEIFESPIEVGPIEGRPQARRIQYVDGGLAGYLLSTRNVVQSKGFSGKPLDLDVAIDIDGIIRGVRIVEHHEPILVIGVAEADLDAFVEQYAGLDIRTPITMVERDPKHGTTVDAVVGATVSSLVINDTILRAARAVARSRGLLGSGELDLGSYSEADWSSLVDEGSLVPVRVTVGEATAKLAEQRARLYPEGVDPPPMDAPLLDIAFGLATPARVGQNIIGEIPYNRAMADLSAGDQLIFIGGAGSTSFKGTDYLRSGIFDRIQIVQGDRTFGFDRDDYRRIDDVAIDGAPNLRDRGLFRISGDGGFDPSLPWRLEILIPASGEDDFDTRAVYTADYVLPDRYRRSVDDVEVSADEPLWQTMWRTRHGEIAVLAVALVLLLLVLLFQDWVVRRQRFYTWFRIGFLTFTLVWLGWYVGAQLSVLNVLTFLESLRSGFDWEIFLLEPLIFILWALVVVTLLFWARGVFCGWLCPFGALQELANRAAQWLRLPQLSVPSAVHERLIALKYVIFLVIFGLSLGAIPFAQNAVEVEPFKTAIILKFDREWTFVVYAVALLGTGLFIPRVFCRYLCPLGAALAIPARLHMFRWLRRRHECGTPCQQCAVTCPVQAIHPQGQISPAECIHCLHCQVYYYDDAICPPLLRQRKALQRLAQDDS